MCYLSDLVNHRIRLLYAEGWERIPTCYKLADVAGVEPG